MAHHIRTLLESVPGCAVNNYIDSGGEVRLLSHSRRQPTDVSKDPCMQNILHILNHHQTHENTSTFWIKQHNGPYKGVEWDNAKDCHTVRRRILDSDQGKPLEFIPWDQWIEDHLEPANQIYLKYNESLLRMQHFSTLMKRVNKDRVRREQEEKKRKTDLRVEKAQLTKDKNEVKKQRMIAKHLELLDDAIETTEIHVTSHHFRNDITSKIRLARNFFGIFMSPRWASQLAALPENWEAEVENDGFIDDEVEEEGVSESTNSEEDRYNSEVHDLDMDDYDL
ncbi:hypothetical protein D6C85_09514 [Aureobasidium pullulans]|uniref:Uncharacterized protein n=1 Tax=Aureobasidium pullulans TaxID=5580 RepID=A0A4V4KVH4_AURPU|nr:hypothetical protein D6C85_09514 [Aureobasidium pullulans]